MSHPNAAGEDETFVQCIFHRCLCVILNLHFDRNNVARLFHEKMTTYKLHAHSYIILDHHFDTENLLRQLFVLISMKALDS